MTTVGINRFVEFQGEEVVPFEGAFTPGAAAGLEGVEVGDAFLPPVAAELSSHYSASASLTLMQYKKQTPWCQDFSASLELMRRNL